MTTGLDSASIIPSALSLSVVVSADTPIDAGITKNAITTRIIMQKRIKNRLFSMSLPTLR
jgi:hypothetical protein